MYRSRKDKPPEQEKQVSRNLESSSFRRSFRGSTQTDTPPSRNSRSRTYEPSPNRKTNFRTFESTPSRATRARTHEPSPPKSRKDEGSKRIFGKFDMSPLRISFRTRRQKQESPTRYSNRETRKLGRDPSPSRDFLRSSQRRFKWDMSPSAGENSRFSIASSPELPARRIRVSIAPSSDSRFGSDEILPRDTARQTRSTRSQKFDTQPNRYIARSRRDDVSPPDENIRNIREEMGLRRSSPSPLRSKSKLESYLGEDIYGSTRSLREDIYGSSKSLNYPPSTPRMQMRSGNYSRLPLREISMSPAMSRSYRISCSSRDDSNDPHYLTKVREILLGDPIKSNTQQPAEILPHMYIGSQSNAESLRLLRKIGVTHVLNCAGFRGPRKNPDANPYEGLDIEYLEFKAEDRDGYDMSQHFDEAFRYLDHVKRIGGTCLVHCALGINRSGVTVTAYLMVHSKWPLLKAVEFVKKKRGVVLSNHGFQRQLIRFARQQSLLDPLPERLSLQSESPASERRFVKSLHQAQFGHWGEALGELRRKSIDEYVESLPTELGSGPESALMYRYARFMNRDKV